MDQYIRDVLKIVVAQICQSIGWHGLQSSALEILIDVLHRYLSQITRISHNHAEHYGMTEPNLDHLGLAFHQMNISIAELEEYISWVEPVPCILSVPQLPVARSTNLNFLKPGSREVVTRPVHIHEHLPPMHPELEQVEDEPPIPVIALDSTSSSGNGSCSSYKNINEPAIPSLSLDSSNSTNNICSLSNSFKPSNIMTLSPKIDPLFKRPGDFLEPPILKRKLMMGEEGRPTREISSVMMTSSGFLSPAREGKLPEARTPQTLSDSPAPAPQYPAVPPELRTEKKVRKVSDLKKKPYNVNKELFKSEKTAATNSNKLKKIIKKVLKHNNDSLPSEKHVEKQIPMQIETCLDNTRKIQNRSTSPVIKTTPKILKPPKLENVLQPPIMQNPIPINTESSNVGKLSNEPDKMKLNIIKKISKVKEEKNETKPEKIDKIKTEPIDFRKLAATNRELHSPEITITPIKAENLKPDIVEKIKTPDIIIKEEPITSNIKSELTLIKSPRFEKNEMTIYDVDMLPAGTLSLPKTPEVVPIQLFPRKIEKEKKKREKKVKVKTKEHKEKSQKQQALQNSRSMQSASLSIEMARPKTPDGPMTIIKSEVPPVINPSIFSVLSNLPRGPSLIPPPINNNPLFSRLPFHPRAVGNRHGFGQPPLLPHGPHMLPVPVSSQVQVRNDSVEVIRLSHSEKVSNISGANVPTKVEITPVEISKNITEVVEKPEKKSKEHKKEKKDKVKLRKKKEKKDKIKNKDKSEKKKEKEEKKEKRATKREKKEKYKEKEKDLKETAAIKLTLKLGSQSSPPTEESSNSRKITIKPVTKKVVEEERSITDREPSPELARISALVTRPPKTPKAGIISPVYINSTLITVPQIPSSSSEDNVHTKLKKSTVKPIPKIKTVDLMKKTSLTATCDEDAGSPVSFSPAAFRPPSQNAQQIIPKPDAFYFDKDGNKVWICPACGGQDDGSPMIGCDDCDAWYHWVCVGIQVPPDDNEDWYCRVCIVKKQEILYTDKKKKRKKRDKRE